MALLLAVAALSVGVASAQSAITLYAGAQLHAQMRMSLDTGTAQVGDQFVLDVVPPYPSGNPAFQGATIIGVVTKVVRAGQGVKPELDVRFQTLRLADGSTVSIDGTMVAATEKKDLRNGGHVALTTIGGMLLGNVIGKTIFHTNAGGLLGAAGGFLYGYNQKSNFTVPRGTAMTIQLERTVVIRRQAQPPY